MRTILKVPSAYIDRSYINKWLLDKANEITRTWKNKIGPISHIIKIMQITLMGHIIRVGIRHNNDPPFNVTFKEIDALRPLRAHTKRVGRPKQKWTEDVMRRA